MGDLSEMRGIVVIITFLGVFAILASTIPTLMMFPSVNPKMVTYEDLLNVDGVPVYKVWQKGNITYDANGEWYDNNINVSQYWFGLSIYNTTNHDYAEGVLVYIWWFNHGGLEGWNANGMTWTIPSINWTSASSANLWFTELDAAYAECVSHSVEFVFTNVNDQGGSPITHFWFRWDKDVYATPSSALEHQGMQISIGQTWEESQSSVSAFTLIGQLMFFQAPSIHPLLNAFIAIPIWAAFSYLVFIIILRVIGAVFGGGGA